MSMAYIRRYYGVPARRGGRVAWGTREGTITSATAYVYVRFDDAMHAVPLHPREDGLRYLPSGERQEDSLDEAIGIVADAARDMGGAS